MVVLIKIKNSLFVVVFKGLIEENVSWNEDLGEWQLKFVAYTGNNMRKPKETEQDLKKVGYKTYFSP